MNKKNAPPQCEGASRLFQRNERLHGPFTCRDRVPPEHDSGRERNDAGLGGGDGLLRRRQRNHPVFVYGDGTVRGEVVLAVIHRFSEVIAVRVRVSRPVQMDVGIAHLTEWDGVPTLRGRNLHVHVDLRGRGRGHRIWRAPRREEGGDGDERYEHRLGVH